MKGRALLFGLNYKHCSSGHLSGCINDALAFAIYLGKTYGIPADVVSDAKDLEGTSRTGMVRHIRDLALRARQEKLDFVWIHYSGHGTWGKDRSGDEKDGKDEYLVASDCEKGGYLRDDELNYLLRRFPPTTKVVLILDCCHSGTMCDLRYSWPGKRRARFENPRSRVRPRVLSISGCLDSQTSADAFNVMGKREYTGAMSSHLLMILKENPGLDQDVLALAEKLRDNLREDRFKQYPLVASNYNLRRNKKLV